MTISFTVFVCVSVCHAVNEIDEFCQKIFCRPTGVVRKGRNLADL